MPQSWPLPDLLLSPSAGRNAADRTAHVTFFHFLFLFPALAKIRQSACVWSLGVPPGNPPVSPPPPEKNNAAIYDRAVGKNRAQQTHDGREGGGIFGQLSCQLCLRAQKMWVSESEGDSDTSQERGFDRTQRGLSQSIINLTPAEKPGATLRNRGFPVPSAADPFFYRDLDRIDPAQSSVLKSPLLKISPSPLNTHLILPAPVITTGGGGGWGLRGRGGRGSLNWVPGKNSAGIDHGWTPDVEKRGLSKTRPNRRKRDN